jgi:hypothetical protein
MRRRRGVFYGVAIPLSAQQQAKSNLYLFQVFLAKHGFR